MFLRITTTIIFSVAAQAIPIYSGIQNVSASGGEIYSLDFDGTEDDVQFFTTPFPAAGPVVGAAGLGDDNALVYNVDAPAALTFGELIGPGSTFGPGTTFGNLNGGNFPPQGYFPTDGVTYAYLGVRFAIGSENHYGWIQLTTLTSERRLTIKDWAYESAPDTPILAGATSVVPEPGSFGLLALGGIIFVACGRKHLGSLRMMTNI